MYRLAPWKSSIRWGWQRKRDEGTIAERALEGRGSRVRRHRQRGLLIEGEIRGEIDFGNIGEGLSPFPFVLMLEPSKTEKLLYDYLREHGNDVEWKTELETFLHNAEEVTARIKTADGRSQEVKARYIVGCDDPKSLVRRSLGLTFGGSTFERIFYVADAD